MCDLSLSLCTFRCASLGISVASSLLAHKFFSSEKEKVVDKYDEELERMYVCICGYVCLFICVLARVCKHVCVIVYVCVCVRVQVYRIS